jgi:hypothetical protein
MAKLILTAAVLIIIDMTGRLALNGLAGTHIESAELGKMLLSEIFILGAFIGALAITGQVKSR